MFNTIQDNVQNAEDGTKALNDLLLAVCCDIGLIEGVAPSYSALFIDGPNEFGEELCLKLTIGDRVVFEYGIKGLDLEYPTVTDRRAALIDKARRVMSMPYLLEKYYKNEPHKTPAEKLQKALEISERSLILVKELNVMISEMELLGCKINCEFVNIGRGKSEVYLEATVKL